MDSQEILDCIFKEVREKITTIRYLYLDKLLFRNEDKFIFCKSEIAYQSLIIIEGTIKEWLSWRNEHEKRVKVKKQQ